MSGSNKQINYLTSELSKAKARIESLEAERDTAIAAAYEVAARAADPAQMTCLDAYDEGRLDAAVDIRALTPDAALAARDRDRAQVRREALEEAAQVADRVHDAAMKWAEKYAKNFAGETDSLRIAAAIRAMIKEEGK